VKGRRIQAFGVFTPKGVLLTSRSNRKDAEFAAGVLAGTNWRKQGYEVDPIVVTRVRTTPTTHHDIIETK
jgi:hypothetical protein